MEKVTREILPGFTPGNKILWNTWKGFGWFGKLQVELDGEFYVMDAGGIARGDHGDVFNIKKIIGHKTPQLHPTTT